MLRERGRLDGRRGIAKHRQEARPLEVRRPIEAARVHERRKEVDELREGHRAGAVPRHPGHVHEQGHPRVEFEIRRLAPERVLPDVIAMIAEEDHDRPLGHAAAAEGVEETSDLGIEVAHVREIPVPHLGDLRRGRLPLVPSRTEHLGALVERDVGRSRGTTTVGRWQRPAVMQIPIATGRVERRMGLPEADREEERAILHLVEHPDRLGRDATVVVGVVRHVAALAESCLGVAEPVDRLGRVGRKHARHERPVIPVVGVVQKLVGTPRASVTPHLRVPVVEDLADAAGRVALSHEPSGQRRHVGVRLAKMGAVVPDAERIRPEAGEQ